MDPLAFGLGGGGQIAGPDAGLLDDHVRLLAGLRAKLVGGPLRRDEAVPEEDVELLVAGDLRLEPLDLVAEVGALAPDVLEALGHVVRARSRRPPAGSRAGGGGAAHVESRQG